MGGNRPRIVAAHWTVASAHPTLAGEDGRVVVAVAVAFNVGLVSILSGVPGARTVASIARLHLIFVKWKTVVTVKDERNEAANCAHERNAQGRDSWSS